MFHRLSALMTVLILFLLSACTPLSPTTSPTSLPDLDHMTFMAGYKPQANLPFVGVYVAQEKGFFTEHEIWMFPSSIPRDRDNTCNWLPREKFRSPPRMLPF